VHNIWLKRIIKNIENLMDNMIQQNICNVALVVNNYDEAIAFYRQKLQFELVGDIDLGGGKRWVEICPPNSTGTNILLAQASNDEQKQSIGNQTGGSVFFSFKPMIFGVIINL
jgi:catechol 2,3-dioxygenase-like lactoylglutathione lyase family enzyme